MSPRMRDAESLFRVVSVCASLSKYCMEREGNSICAKFKIAVQVPYLLVTYAVTVPLTAALVFRRVQRFQAEARTAAASAGGARSKCRGVRLRAVFLWGRSVSGCSVCTEKLQTARILLSAASI